MRVHTLSFLDIIHTISGIRSSEQCRRTTMGEGVVHFLTIVNEVRR